jgi:hypothetical protein
VIKKFEAATAPHEAKLKQMQELLRQLLDGKYLSISVSLFQQYMEEKKGNTNDTNTNGTGTSSSSSTPVTSTTAAAVVASSSSPTITHMDTLAKLSTGDNFINYAEACIRRHKTAETAVTKAAKAESDRYGDCYTIPLYALYAPFYVIRLFIVM